MHTDKGKPVMKDTKFLSQQVSDYRNFYSKQKISYKLYFNYLYEITYLLIELSEYHDIHKKIDTSRINNCTQKHY